MTLFTLRRSGRPIAVVMLLCFLATFLPARVSRGDTAAALAPLSDGVGGPAGLASGLDPSAGSPKTQAIVDLSTGSARTGFAFRLPRARGDAQPSLGLAYNSSQGVGFAGVGWTLGVPSIVRQGVSGYPTFNDELLSKTPLTPTSDDYVVDGVRLVPLCVVSGNSCAQSVPGEAFPAAFNGFAYYRREIDDGARYFLGNGGNTWLVETKSGHVLTFGDRMPGDTLLTDGAEHLPTKSVLPNGPLLNRPVYRWNLIRDSDEAHNEVFYAYDTEQALLPAGVTSQGLLYLTDIYDTQPTARLVLQPSLFAHRIHLSWQLPFAQIDPIVAPIWRELPFARLSRVDITSAATKSDLSSRYLVRSYLLQYIANDWQTQSYLSEIDTTGNFGPSSPSFEPATYLVTAPTLTSTFFTYNHFAGATQPALPEIVSSASTRGVNAGNASFPATSELLDVDGDGIADFIQGPFLENPADPNSPAYLSLAASRATTVRLLMSPSNPSGLKATIKDLVPQAPQTISGPWQFNEQLNLLFLNQNASTHVASPEIYSVDIPTGTLVGQAIPQVNGAAGWTSGRSLDVDGDGLPDMTLVPEAGSSVGFNTYFSVMDKHGNLAPFANATTTACATTDMDPTTYGTDTFRTMTDMDGDGLPDLVVVSKTANVGIFELGVLGNRGTGEFGGANTGCSDPTTLHSSGTAVKTTSLIQLGTAITPDALNQSVVRFGDLNGDHLSDFAILSPHGLNVCLRTGSSIATMQWSCMSETPAQLGVPAGSSLDPRQWVFDLADVGGTGTLQVVYMPPQQQGQALSFTAPPTGVLTDVRTTEGAETTLTYKPGLRGDDPGPSDWSPVPVWVVGRMTTTNGLTGVLESSQSLTEYGYGHPVYDPVDRAFVGFTTATETRPSDINIQGYARTTTFGTQGCADPFQCFASYQRGPARAVRNLVALVEEQDTDSSQRYRTTWNEYRLTDVYTGLDATVVLQVPVYQTHTYLFDQTTASTPVPEQWLLVDGAVQVTADLPVGGREIRAQQTFDSAYDPISSVDFGVVGTDTPIRQETRGWALPSGDTTGWSLRPSTVQIGNADPTGATFTEAGRTLTFDYTAAGQLKDEYGTLTGAIPLPGPPGQPRAAGQPPSAAASGQVTLKTLAYDAFGNVTSTSDQAGHCVGTDYDPVYAQLPAHLYTYRGGCGQQPLTTTLTFDRILENLTLRSSPSGRATQYQYNDDFGRLTEVDQQDVGLLSPPGVTAPAAATKITYGGDRSPFRFVDIQTADGAELLPAYVDHQVFVDGFNDVMARLDSAGDPAGPQYLVTGLHMRGARGEVTTAYLPFYTPQSPLSGLILFAGSQTG